MVMSHSSVGLRSFARVSDSRFMKYGRDVNVINRPSQIQNKSIESLDEALPVQDSAVSDTSRNFAVSSLGELTIDVMLSHWLIDS